MIVTMKCIALAAELMRRGGLTPEEAAPAVVAMLEGRGYPVTDETMKELERLAVEVGELIDKAGWEAGGLT